MTLVILTLGALVILGSNVRFLDSKISKGCTAPLLLPEKPFFVVWNHPTSICEAKGVNLNFDKWGIVNNNKDSFIGEQISLFYGLGQFPQFSGSTIYNGGIPQLGNLTDHLQKVDSDINTEIPSPSFSGLGVIDFEAWRPIFSLNFDSLKIYQEKSLELAKQKFPDYNRSQLLQEATKEFEEAARSFMETTLQKVSLLRQNGQWGYYGYPRCWDTNCNTSTVQINDKMAWIYNLSTSLYPSIYFSRSEPENVRASKIKKIIHETLRVKATWSPQDAAILPYALIQDSSYDLFNQSDLSYSIREPADMGSSGVVLWGSSSMMHAKNECIVLQGYINNTLGPFVLHVTNFFANCSQQLCQNHGRCVRKDYDKYYQYHLKKSGHTACSIPDARFNSKKNRMNSDHHLKSGLTDCFIPVRLIQKKKRLKTEYNLEKKRMKTEYNLKKTNKKTEYNLKKTKIKTKYNLKKTKIKTKYNLKKKKMTEYNLKKKKKKTEHNLKKTKIKTKYNLKKKKMKTKYNLKKKKKKTEHNLKKTKIKTKYNLKKKKMKTEYNLKKKKMKTKYCLKKIERTDCSMPDVTLIRKKKRLQMDPYKNINSKNNVNKNDIINFSIEKSEPHLNTNQFFLRDDPNKEPLDDFDDYVCKCFAGWSGDHCEHKIKE